MDWFKRHLNWTILIVLLVSSFLAFFAIFLESGGLFFIGLIIWMLMGKRVCGWVLRQKEQSQWNLLSLLLGWGIGLILIISLQNKRLKSERVPFYREDYEG